MEEIILVFLKEWTTYSSLGELYVSRYNVRGEK